jgi:hypothetical protein
MERGYQNERATLEDWANHLTTIFTEVRLKTYIEIRSADSQPPGMMLALPGLVVGALLAAGLARVVSASLVEVSPRDPVIYAAAALFTVLITLCAAANPARRAAKVDPMVALSYE